jgi:hypothetical protein
VRGERFVLGAVAVGAILYLLLYPWAGLQRTTADNPATPTVSGPPCPELVATAIRQSGQVTGTPMTVELSYASGPDRAYVCAVPSGQAYYFGMKFSGNTLSAIALPATPKGDGFQAVNGKTVYYVDSDSLQKN